MKTPALYDPITFFALPVHESMEPEIAVLEARDQPTGFVDESGDTWVAVFVDGDLKRQKLVE